MKKHLISPGMAVFATLILAVAAHASTLFSEDFRYPSGALEGRGGWGNGGGSGSAIVGIPTLTTYGSGDTKASATGDNEVIISGKTLFRGLGLHTSNSISGAFFIGFIAQVESGSTGFSGIRLKNTTTNTQMLVGQLFRADKSKVWGLNVEGAGIDKNGANIRADYTEIDNGKPTLLVAEIVFVSDVAADVNLYVNPVVSKAPGTMSLLSTPAASLKGVLIGKGFNQIQVLAKEGSVMAVDSIRIGTTLSDVLP